MKKRMIVCILCAAVMSSACGRAQERQLTAQEERIVGMWEAKWLRSSGEEALIDEFTQAVGMGNVDVCLDFMADGTLDASYNERVSHGTWTVSDADDTYTITVDGRSGDVVWADDTVTLEMDGTAIVFVQTEE
ncbi:MAG TPA: hypothetical protein IAB53_02900 [Candidatus Scybalocola faecipullorum]|nr:hypothetical protein [Candidatus Scybalocola faecipullorum]